MKKWEYMLATFDFRRLSHINGKEISNFEPMKWPVFFSSFREPVSAKGIYMSDFLTEAGKNGWEVINIWGTSIENILLKRELEEKKGD
jgi:hypothetical protein